MHKGAGLLRMALQNTGRINEAQLFTVPSVNYPTVNNIIVILTTLYLELTLQLRPYVTWQSLSGLW